MVKKNKSDLERRLRLMEITVVILVISVLLLSISPLMHHRTHKSQMDFDEQVVAFARETVRNGELTIENIELLIEKVKLIEKKLDSNRGYNEKELEECLKKIVTDKDKCLRKEFQVIITSSGLPPRVLCFNPDNISKNTIFFSQEEKRGCGI